MPLIFGTWKIDPYYGKVHNWLEAENIIDYAIYQNILNFDTAIAYGEGKIEAILGRYENISNLNIITKIPAKVRNKNLDANIQSLYPKSWIEKNLIESTNRLKRNDHTVLLHNYNNWEGIEDVIDELMTWKSKGFMKKIGISLSNNFESTVNIDVLDKIDLLEVPYNSQDLWLHRNFKYISHKELVLRSLLKDNNKKIINENTFLDATNYSNNLIVGMTKYHQIDENINIFKHMGV